MRTIANLIQDTNVPSLTKKQNREEPYQSRSSFDCMRKNKEHWSETTDTIQCCLSSMQIARVVMMCGASTETITVPRPKRYPAPHEQKVRGRIGLSNTIASRFEYSSCKGKVTRAASLCSVSRQGNGMPQHPAAFTELS
jgi:hypothetical protein